MAGEERLQKRRGQFLRVAVTVMVMGQVPGAWVLYRALLAVEEDPLWAVLLLLYFNVGLGVGLAYAFPERPLNRLLKVGLVLPWWGWFVTAALVLPFGLFLLPLSMLNDLLLEPLVPEIWVGQLCLALLLMAATASVWSITVRRHWVVVHEIEVAIPGLSPDFAGYRIVHLSDLHVGNYAPGSTLRRWVEKANALKPDLIALTGDLIASGEAWLPELLDGLRELRAPDGVAMCPGNHDYWAGGASFFRALEAVGVEVLQNRGHFVGRGESVLFIAGVDDTWSGKHNVDQALALRPPHTPVVLLAHDPSLFPLAVKREVSLMLSGHTHGGQWGVPFVPRWNLSTRVYEFTVGLYRRGTSTLYVHRGLGTTGPPARLGVPPELVVLVLKPA